MPQKVNKEKELWTADQSKQFLESIKDERFYPIFSLFFTYGMRRGEALGLRWKDIDFENKTIHLRQQVIQINSQIMIGDLKTNASQRELPLLPHIEQVLKSVERMDNQYDLIFVSSQKTPIRPSNLHREFRKCEKPIICHT